MSRRALHLAVRDQLRLAAPDGLGLRPEECEVTVDGRPHARAGKRFVAVHPGPRTGGPQNRGGCVWYAFDFLVTLTLRVNEPLDRVGTALMDRGEDGLDDLADLVVARLTAAEIAVLTRANATLEATFNQEGTRRGMVEGYYFAGDDAAQWVGADWFHAEEGEAVGLALPMRFTGAMRVQAIENPELS